jgi:hypothetical protein
MVEILQAEIVCGEVGRLDLLSYGFIRISGQLRKVCMWNQKEQWATHHKLASYVQSHIDVHFIGQHRSTTTTAKNNRAPELLVQLWLDSPNSKQHMDGTECHILPITENPGNHEALTCGFVLSLQKGVKGQYKRIGFWKSYFDISMLLRSLDFSLDEQSYEESDGQGGYTICII